ncbi:MAG: PD-(D/E)XK nuclease family protein [Burkholderiales bacterium]|nr:PD-(D/E)XK nuclease family protein [Burkholderiales bacterium]
MDAQLIRQVEGGATLVTPTRRLARDLVRRFDLAQAAAGRRVWNSADILPWDAWITRSLQAHAGEDAALQVLDPMQELALWRRTIDSAGSAPLLDAAAAARTARDARAIQLAWRVDCSGPASEEVGAYLEWVRRFEAICRRQGWTEPARRIDVLSEQVRVHGRLSRGELVLYGFDALLPQMRALLESCRQAGLGVSEREPAPLSGQVRRSACVDEEDERREVACQVRELLLHHPHARIGIVVPALAAARDAWMHALDDALQPARCLPDWSGAPRPYNLSLGQPLSALPMVDAALTILRLAQGRLTLADLGVLLRGPFLAESEAERIARAHLDAQLRRQGAPEVTLDGLLAAARGRTPEDPAACRRLAARLRNWMAQARTALDHRQLPSAWSETFLELCSGLGWPGERVLDSEEYQTQRKWLECVSGLGHLDAQLGRISYAEALAWLARTAADTLFQPETPEVPVQVVGALESVGLQFDHLFVTGLHDEAWPQAPRPNPFLPLARQRTAGVAHASAEWESAFATRMIATWKTAAPQVCFTYPTRQGDRPLRVSALLQDVQLVERPTAMPSTLAQRMQQGARLEEITDGSARALAHGFEVSGGAAVLENQAACPFRAFATHRLGARPLEEAHSGLDARERGSLLHHALATLWERVPSHAALLALDAQQQRDVVDHAVDAAIAAARTDVLTPAFAAIERARLCALLDQLLLIERARADFRVIEREAPRAFEFAGLRLRARVDRVDALADGRRIVLDYKTGSSRVSQWLGERPDAPQLPLYALIEAGEVAALAFAGVRAGAVGFTGVASEEGLLPGVGAVQPDKMGVADFPALLAAWRARLGALAAEFLGGHAVVAPKRYPATCRWCALGSMCRVTELFDRGPVSVEDDGSDD